ncbi:hypothetical protein FisN_4Lu592 [Fistulifera solaris]|uniref:Uncharacterized protein n=1 Tax=Fistulifera solaris TaxID=1519565 RepID=A0A1Z5KDF0_FISSO|nr:hypothetical protein FisN_4Lu592 [Fistulifera solaris]|eukprot:GAX24216.1 hypothetical protein FisN_4Lu592 [Fistulifera solaris]
MSAQPQNKQGRIPLALQAVFLASNRGKEVHKPPPEKAANKVFFRNWLFQKASTSISRGKKSQIVQTADVKAPTETKKRPALRKTDSTDNLLNPQAYMDAMLRYRGYSTKRYHTLQSGYYNKPSPHQRASYNIHLIGLILDNPKDALPDDMACMVAAGKLSPQEARMLTEDNEATEAMSNDGSEDYSDDDDSEYDSENDDWDEEDEELLDVLGGLPQIAIRE